MNIKDRLEKNMMNWKKYYSSKNLDEINSIIEDIFMDSMIFFHNSEQKYVKQIRDFSVEEKHFLIECVLKYLKNNNNTKQRRNILKENKTVEKYKKFIKLYNTYNAVEEILNLIFDPKKDFPENHRPGRHTHPFP